MSTSTTEQEQLALMTQVVQAHAQRKCQTCFGTGRAVYLRGETKDTREPYAGTCQCAWRRFSARNGSYLISNHKTVKGAYVRPLFGRWESAYNWGLWIQNNEALLAKFVAAKHDQAQLNSPNPNPPGLVPAEVSP